ncbi:thiamine pyrophosphate-dependent enzyme [Tepidamorphus sp. 3E244]|uniref:thiamine pyrophosphate-dependent enzyme n=1 Tax=Tepidamorphus sp. 3E244 TaxID=3385498 RepID=UPI0038FC660C
MASQATNARLDRREIVEKLLEKRDDLLVVTGLGSSAYDVAAVGDSHRNFYLWGAMGGAAMVGLGLAVARPDQHVAVITGDGEQLMGMGALATIAARKQKNLTVVVLDNQHYGETGMQASHTGLGVDLVGVAKACGFNWTMRVEDESGLPDLIAKLKSGEGPGFASVLIEAKPYPRALPPRDGVEVKNRFRRELGLETI